MKKNNECKIVRLRNIILFVLLLFSVMFPLSVYAEEKEIVISFKDANAGSCGIPDLVIHPGETITLPKAPAERDTTNTIYGVPSWKPVLEGCGRYLKSSDILTYDQVSALSESYGTENGLILYGTRALSLAYYNNDGSKKLWQLYYYEGSTATLRDTPYAPNKAYKGWTTEKNGTSVALQFRQKVKLYEDLNVYLVTYARVRYYYKNGSKLYSIEYYKRGTDALMLNVPVQSKYRALGWSANKNGSKVYAAAGAKVTISGDLDLYAVYKYVPYTIKFADNNGNSTAKAFKDLTQQAASGEYITLPKVPAAANYIALGWSYKAGDTAARAKPGDKVKISKNLTFYAVCRKAKTLTIKYVDQDGTTSSDLSALKKTLKEGTVFVLPAVPKKVGYDPVCWRIKINGELKSYNAGTKVTARGNYCYYAYYKRKADAQVILHYVSGKNYKAIYVKKGEKFTFPCMDNPEGYTFMGWGSNKGMFLSETRSQTYHQAGTTVTINGPVDFYAVMMKRSEEKNFTAEKLSGSTSPDVSAYKQIFFVGDSRTHRLMKTLKAEGIDYKKKKVTFICEGGTRLDWLKTEGYPKLIEAVKKSDSKDKRPIAVIFNHGVNDLFSSDDYIAYYKSIAPKLKEMNCRLFIMSVNPVNSIRHEKTNRRIRYEYEVRDFNKKLKENLGGLYSYIDTYTWLMRTGYSTDGGNGQDCGVDDGIHYTVKTYKRIYLRALQFLAGVVKY